MLPQAASEQYRAQQRLTVATLSLTNAAWARMSLADLDGSWDAIAGLVFRIVSSAQVGAARNGAGFVPAALEQLGQSVDPVALVRPLGFSGVASDGRPLESLLLGAKIRAKEAQSLEVGGAWLDMVAHTMVADASRGAASVAGFVRPSVSFVRAANPPCCQRCAVLSGKHSRSDEAFRRHPRCDCFNIPTTDPASITAPIIGLEDVKDLTKSQRLAITDGADWNQVINAKRARSKDGLTTTEGVTKRGISGKRLIAANGTEGKVGRYNKAKSARLTPEGIYRVAGDRPEALRLLRLHGYLI